MALAGCSTAGSSTTDTTATPNPLARFVPTINRSVAAAVRTVAVPLPTRLGAPAPTLGPTAFPKPIAPHQVIGFLPYWELGSFTPDYSTLTALAYYAAFVRPGGGLDTDPATDPGWAGLQGAALAGDVQQAHAAGTRVLLTVFTDSDKILATLAKSPASAARTMSADVAAQLRAHGLDGVDLDLEGTGMGSRAGFVRFVAAFSSDLRAIDASWSIVLNTYASSALDPAGFFDVAALAPHVDELFIMAYDMQSDTEPSATAPLTGAQMSAASALAEYTSIVPARRLVLGIPYYGYDFPSSGPYPPAIATGRPLAVTYAAILAAAHAPLWDPTTKTPFSSFRRGKAWHQTWFDDPVSVALKTALAAQFRCAGVGVWDLGMSGGDPTINSALLGGSAALKLPLATQP